MVLVIKYLKMEIHIQVVIKMENLKDKDNIIGKNNRHNLEVYSKTVKELLELGKTLKVTNILVIIKMI